MDTIRIKPVYSVVVHSPNTVELRQGVWNSVSHMLNDEKEDNILAEIVLGLKAQLPLPDISKNLGISRAKVESVLDHLHQLGVLQTGAESFLDYYVENYIPSLRSTLYNKYKIQMPVVLLGDIDLVQQIKKQLSVINEIEIIEDESYWSQLKNILEDDLNDALLREHVIASFKNLENKFVVLVQSHINPILSARFNCIAHQLNIAWLHLAVDGPFLFVGPLFKGQNGPCYECFETRISMNLREGDSYRNYKNAIYKNQVYTSSHDPLLTITTQLLVAHASLEILNFLSTKNSFVTHKVLTIFLPTMEFIYHDVLRLSACKTCGSTTHRDNGQLYFDFQKLIGGVN